MDNRSKAPDKSPQDKSHPGKNPSNNKPPRFIEEIIAKYIVDANLLAFVRVAFIRGLFVWGLLT